MNKVKDQASSVIKPRNLIISFKRETRHSYVIHIVEVRCLEAEIMMIVSSTAYSLCNASM